MKIIAKLLNINIPFILASESPRRRKLLEQIGLDFEVIPAAIDENNHSGAFTPSEYTMSLALKKANTVADYINKQALVLGADTIVVLDGEILNKPSDEKEAIEMLSKLSGRTHNVYTGIALVETQLNNSITDYCKTEVTFRKLEQDEIEAYVLSGSPLDKAGAYGIQDDFGAVFVSHINGCYYNIVGLPLELLYSTIKKFLGSIYCCMSGGNT